MFFNNHQQELLDDKHECEQQTQIDDVYRYQHHRQVDTNHRSSRNNIYIQMYTQQPALLMYECLNQLIQVHDVSIVNKH